jgi:hypothetical protein
MSWVDKQRIRKPGPVPAAGCWRPGIAGTQPHVTARQVMNYLLALLQHDPQELQVVKASAREWWGGLKAARAAKF